MFGQKETKKSAFGMQTASVAVAQPLQPTFPKYPVLTLEKRAATVIETKPELKDFVEILMEKSKELHRAEEAVADWVNPNGTPIVSKAGKVDAGVAKVLDVLAKGYEPTTLPTHWYAGSIRPKEELIGAWSTRGFTDRREGGLVETWKSKWDAPRRETPVFPERNPAALTTGELMAQSLMAREMARQMSLSSDRWTPSTTISATRMVASFVAPLPRAAFDAWKKAEEVFGWQEMRVYSPDQSHFQQNIVRPIDPVIIGRVNLGNGEFQHFEVFRWDIKEDIAHALNAANK